MILTMAKKNTKLELTWIGKNQRPKLEPRILIEDPDKSYHAAHRVSENDIFDNRLIFGDNLLALKAMEQEFAGKVKCICMDPPYNTGAAFEQYDDGVEHSLWLSLMRDRFEILHRLLTPDGSVWVCIDDNEAAYLRVLLDELFGRQNFVTSVIWEKRKSRENRRVFSFKHDYVLVFAKDRKQFEGVRNMLPLDQATLDRYKNPDDDPRGPWQSVSANAMAGHATPNQFYTLTAPSGVNHDPPPGRCWLYTNGRMQEEIDKGNIWFGRNGTGVPRIKKFLTDYEDKGLTPDTLWYANEVGTNDIAKKQLKHLFGGQVVFDTPKPEGLMERIIHIATQPGELVLDSFAGSGTTGAVAHKMGRQWIMVELGKHCDEVIIPRMQEVVKAADPHGITEAYDWKGGGGFRYFRLGPSLLKKDEWGNWVINTDFNPEMLAEAVCKLEGFTYAPSDEVYWQHGHSTETDFIYVTTQFMNREMLTRLSDEVGENRSLLVVCKAFRVKPDAFENLTLKKIPKAVLRKCEWGKDDYSLEIRDLPPAPPEYPAAQESRQDATRRKPARTFGKGKDAAPSLFDWPNNEVSE